MGKKDELYVSVPSFFRCPISLDVMKSPVSLSTGVSYDRTSIQRWLDSGNNTCPATMQVLPTKDFVPNLTLQRLIQIWSTTNNHHRPSAVNGCRLQFQSLSTAVVSELIKQTIENDKENDIISFESVVKILCFASESDENRRFLGKNDKLVDFLIRTVSSRGPDLDPDLLEAVLKILHLVIILNDKMKSSSSCDLVSALVRVLNTGRPGSKVAAAGIIETLSLDPDTKKNIFDQQELGLEIFVVLKQGKFDEEVEKQAVLSCLISLSSARRIKQKLVRAGGVKLVGEMISSHDNNIITDGNNIVTVELLFTLLEMLAGCTEGRVAISDDPNCVPTIINKLMKVSKTTNEHGVTLLWSLCYLLRDQRVKEAVMRSNGGLTKILLLMQSDCSPAVKRMCCDLLRIFRVNSKSCLSSYDTKTTHIMPC